MGRRTSAATNQKIMALKYKVTKREEIPVEHASLYVEREGAFYADIEGATGRAEFSAIGRQLSAIRGQRSVVSGHQSSSRC